MKEIVVISGKGGTGKTSITAAFAYLGGKKVLVADCDVDAADMHLLLKPDFAFSEDFFSGELAEINQDICTQCGACKDVCRFDAVNVVDGVHRIDPLNCEGCGYCAIICPVRAISMKTQKAGNFYISKTKGESIMVHAKLGIGNDNSGKLVTKVKKEARKIAREKQKEFIIVDGSPGIGCPVVSSITGANFIIFVTEPTVSGLHDLKRVNQMVQKFHIPSGCIINKSDLNKEKTGEILKYLQKEQIIHIASLPYDEDFTEAMTNGLTISEYNNKELSHTISTSWEYIKTLTTS